MGRCYYSFLLCDLVEVKIIRVLMEAMHQLGLDEG